MSLNHRDKLILKRLAQFRVLTRLQIEELAFSESTSGPTRTAKTNRVLKRLTQSGLITQVRRPIGEPYRYMPNPPLTHVESSKSKHFLEIADLFIKLGRPKVFVVEPKVSADYQPDVYARLPEPVIIEYQRSNIGTGEMQSKVDRFHESLLRGDHDARILWIASAAKQYKIKSPEGIVIAQFHPRLIANIMRKDNAD